MKNIFRRSVQIFHKKDKDDGSGSGKDGSRKDNGVEGSPSSKHSSKKNKNRNSKSFDSIVAASDQSPNSSSRGNGNNIYSTPSSPISSSTGIPIGYSNHSGGGNGGNVTGFGGYNDGLKRVFGVQLSDVPCRDNSRVPVIVEKLVEHLERTSLQTEGLFRIPGRDSEIMECVRLFDSGADVDVSSIESYTAAGLLKRFFRDLPVFVPATINKRVAQLFVGEDGKKKQIDMDVLEKIRQLVHCLPPVHFEVMQSLTGLLSKLLSRSAENKMTVSNIAICLVPTLNCVPAIVTYPIQYHDYFFNEPFAEHHHLHMRPASVGSFIPLTEEKSSEIANEMQKRYSRPASITVSGLLPTNGTSVASGSPSSSTITSTTITSPHDATTPITFTVTTTYLEEQQRLANAINNNRGSGNGTTTTTTTTSNTQATPSIQVTQPNEQPPQQDRTATYSSRRKQQLEDLQYQQFIEENQFLKNYYGNSNDQSPQQPQQPQQQQPSSTTSSSLLNNYQQNRYRRSAIIGGEFDLTSLNNSLGIQNNNTNNPVLVNNTITKQNIQQLKEKIDRYSKEKMRELKESQRDIRPPSSLGGTITSTTSTTSTTTNPNNNPLLNNQTLMVDKPLDPKMHRYSVGFESYKDRRCSRDIGREIEREIEKRLSPRERISMLLNGGIGNYIDSNGGIGGSLSSGNSSSIGSSRESKSFRYSNQYSYGNNKYVTRDFNQQQQLPQNNNNNNQNNNNNNNRYSRDYSFRYSREYNEDDEELQSIRQRSQSCFEPDPMLVNPPVSSSSYQSVLLEQKLDKLKETINNIRIDRDNRTSRDYTMHIRDMDELRQSLQKESETSEFFAIKSLELVEKLRQEEEKNQKLMEEIQLMETYFHLKEKFKKSKNRSSSSSSSNSSQSGSSGGSSNPMTNSTKLTSTRSRSPTLPISINQSPSLNNNNNNNNNTNNTQTISGSPKENLSLSTSSTSSRKM